jgi:hypothetical protein
MKKCGSSIRLRLKLETQTGLKRSRRYGNMQLAPLPLTTL